MQSYSNFSIQAVSFNNSYLKFSAVIQTYETDVIKEFVIRGNDALIKCSIPSFVTDFVTVRSWIVQSSENDIEVASLTGKQKFK